MPQGHHVVGGADVVEADAGEADGALWPLRQRGGVGWDLGRMRRLVLHSRRWLWALCLVGGSALWLARGLGRELEGGYFCKRWRLLSMCKGGGGSLLYEAEAERFARCER